LTDDPPGGLDAVHDGHAYVPRVGIERIRAIVVEDTKEIATRLDEAMQASIDAYQDPWQRSGPERLAPVADVGVKFEANGRVDEHGEMYNFSRLR
jgi:hypothetical protein